MVVVKIMSFYMVLELSLSYKTKIDRSSLSIKFQPTILQPSIFNLTSFRV